MKTFIYALCGIVLFGVLGLIGVVVYLVTRTEVEKNRERTAPARANRWPDKKIDLQGKTEAEVNKELDEILKKTKPPTDENQG